MNAIANVPMGLNPTMVFVEEDDHSQYSDESPSGTGPTEDMFAPWDFAVNAFAPAPTDFHAATNAFGGMMDTQQSAMMAAAANAFNQPSGSIFVAAEAAANKRKNAPRGNDSSSDESSDGGAAPGGAPAAKRKRTSRSTRLSPEEKLRRKLERQVARRQRKSIREKERRNSVNILFDEMSKMLGLPKECSDRRTVLSKAIHVFEKLGAELITNAQKGEPAKEPSTAAPVTVKAN
jgi:hypothetical protein